MCPLHGGRTTRYTAAVYTAREHVFAHENGPYTVTAVPYTRPVNGRVWAVPVYTTRVHDCVRAVCTVVFGRVHGVYTAPYTGRVDRRVHVSTCTRAVYTAVHEPSTRPKTAVYTAVHGRVYVSCIRPCTGRIASCTRQCTGRVHGHFRLCTLAEYTAVFGRLHSAYTAGVHGRVMARVLGRYTAVYKGRLGRVYGK